MTHLKKQALLVSKAVQTCKNQPQNFRLKKIGVAEGKENRP